MNPELQIQNVPPRTKSLVLIVDDPEATGGNFTHWVVWNIDPMTQFIKEESVPPGAFEGKTSFGKIGYGGPCPPSGKPHRYRFKLYALDVVLDLDEGAPLTLLEDEMEDHVVEECELVGTYER